MIVFLSFIFFLSGLSALTFEIIWFHAAGLVLGNTIWTASIVLAGFMVGLALGSGAAALKRRQINSPFGLFVFLEASIGISGLLLVFTFPHLTKFLVPFFRLFLGEPPLLNLARMFVVFVLLLVPTMAMGATLPVLMKAFYPRDHNYGHLLGILYGWNTLGAVAGVLASEFFCIQKFGIYGTGVFAALCSGIAALGGGVVLRQKKIPSENLLKDRASFISMPLSKGVSFLLAAGFLSGFILLALEVVWFRFLILFFNPVSMNFAIMLAMVLMGLGCGGLLSSKGFAIRPQAHFYLAVLACLSGALILFLYAHFYRLLLVINIDKMSDFMGLLLCSFFLIFPIAGISGIIFTMLGNALHALLNEETVAVGLLAMANTLGGMCGALTGGLVLLGGLGIERSFFLLACLYGVVAIFTARQEGWRAAAKTAVLYKGAAGILILSVAVFPFGLMEGVLSKVPLRLFLEEGARRVVFKEGANETIQYLRKDLLGEPYYYYLITNNYSMVSTAEIARRYMSFFVYWPQAVHPNIKKALLIAYGSGTTARALTDIKSIEHIDIVDTSKDILETSAFLFSSRLENPLSDPRVKVYLEDGRFFLLSTPDKYDLITGEPPPAKVRGVVDLYTQEYFQLMADRLREGGIVTYWLPVTQLSVGEAKSIIKGFCNVFSDCSLWAALPHSWMLVGTKNLRKGNSYKHFIRPWGDPVAGPALRGLGFENAEDMGSLFIADGPRLEQWLYNSLPLVDNYPKRLSDTVPAEDSFEPAFAAFMDPVASQRNFLSSPFIARLWPEKLRLTTINHFAFRDIVLRIISGDLGMTLIDKLFLCLKEPLLRPYLVWALNSDNRAQEIIRDALREHKQVTLGDAGEHLAAQIVLEGNYDLAQSYYAQLNKIQPSEADVFFGLRMYLLFLAGEKEKAGEVGNEYINLSTQGQAQRKKKIQDFWVWLNEK